MFKNLFKKSKPEISVDTLTGEQLAKYLIKHGCATCDSTPFKYIPGPQGGMSENMWCSTCGTRYNFAHIPGHPIAEIICKFERKEEINHANARI